MSEAGRAQTGGLFRDRVHSLLRTSILDAAWAMAAEVSWSQVRMGDLADHVGVSRQTIYNEFGSKDDLVVALFERELALFLDGVETRVAAAERYDVAIKSVVLWLLEAVQEHRLLSRMMADARAGSTDGLIPILTVDSDAIIIPVRDRVARLMLDRWPELDPTATAVCAELVVRFVLGQVVTPTRLDRGLMVDAVVAMTVALLGPPESTENRVQGGQGRIDV